MPEIKILFEDDQMLVVDKPAGILVYYPPHFTQDEKTLIDLLAGHLNFDKRTGREGIVHRLDRDTSGLLVVAKNIEAEGSLKKQFKERQVAKHYIALVHGKLESDHGRISIPLGRAPKDRLKVVPKASGKPSETLYRVLSYYPTKDLSLLEIELKTGRTHQIRVHMSAIGHPVVGDKVYGRKSDTLGRQFLHAAKLELRSPADGKKIKIESELPPALSSYLSNIS